MKTIFKFVDVQESLTVRAVTVSILESLTITSKYTNGFRKQLIKLKSIKHDITTNKK